MSPLSGSPGVEPVIPPRHVVDRNAAQHLVPEVGEDDPPEKRTVERQRARLKRLPADAATLDGTGCVVSDRDVRAPRLSALPWRRPALLLGKSALCCKPGLPVHTGMKGLGCDVSRKIGPDIGRLVPTRGKATQLPEASSGGLPDLGCHACAFRRAPYVP